MFDAKEFEAKVNGLSPYQRPDTQFLGAKEAYENVIEKIKADEASPNRLFDQFLSEKSLNVQKINGNKKDFESSAAYSLSKQSSSVKVNDHDEDEDDEIRKRISRIMSEYAENNAVEDRKLAKHRFEDDEKYWKQSI